MQRTTTAPVSVNPVETGGRILTSIEINRAAQRHPWAAEVQLRRLPMRELCTTETNRATWRCLAERRLLAAIVLRAILDALSKPDVLRTTGTPRRPSLREHLEARMWLLSGARSLCSCGWILEELGLSVGAAQKRLRLAMTDSTVAARMLARIRWDTGGDEEAA